MRTPLAIAALLLQVAANVHAHGGEDHSAPPPPPTQAVAPRAAAATEEFEAVVVLDAGKLLLYLDRFASNAPVAGAKVEIEGGPFKGVANETSPGIYALDAKSVPAGKHPLTITIEAGDSADLLSASLDIGPPAPAAPEAPGWRNALAWTVAGLLVLAAGLKLMRRRTRKDAA